MTQPYSLTQVVTDGRLTAPRWVQHLVKVATSATIAAIWHFAPARFPWITAAVMGGPVLWLFLVIHELIKPTDLQPLTPWQRIADWMTDCALACVPLAVALLHHGARVGGMLLGGACVAAYIVGHRDARP